MALREASPLAGPPGRLRTALAAAGYSGGGAPSPRRYPVLLRQADDAPPATRTALRLFRLERPVPAEDVERHLAPLRADDLLELGLAAADGADLRPLLRLALHDRFLVASDLTVTRTQDVVQGVTRPTQLLSHLTVRRPVRRALEIGTGNGLLAMVASTHAEHVVATDVNEHALAVAELNLRLNGIENVELRLGSFLEPVAGERFGLAFSNPPYVVSPDTAYVFRDGGLGRDRVSEQLSSSLPSVLEDGGFATITLSWIGDDAARPLAWTEGTGCDAWLLHTTSEDALETAAAWNRELERDADAYAAAIRRWVDWYRAEGIDAVSYGALVLRRRDGANWRRSMRLPAAALEPASDQLLRLFAAQDAPLADDTPVRAAPDVVLRHTWAPGEGGWRPTGAELALVGGLGSTAALDAAGTRLLRELDGRPLREAVAAAGLGDRADEARGFARTLHELGFLVRE